MYSRISIHLDWLRYTVPNPGRLTRDEILQAALPSRKEFAFREEIRVGSQGYNSGARLAAGSVFWHTERPAQGIGVQLSGSDLQTLRDADIPEIELLTWLTSHGGNVTTIHAAIDVMDAQATTRQVIEAWEAGNATVKARSIAKFSSETKVGKSWITGETLYLGSAKSDLRLRVYDKGAEQQTEADWLRIEMVWKGRYASAACAAMLVYGIEQVTRTAVQGQASFPLDWWDKALTGETSPPITMPRKPTKTYKWLKYSVLPVLLKELDEQNRANDDGLWIAFYMGIMQHRPDIPLDGDVAGTT